MADAAQPPAQGVPGGPSGPGGPGGPGGPSYQENVGQYSQPQREGEYQVDAGGYFAIRARGLPYDATKNEVVQFFSDCNIQNGKEGIHILLGPDGRLLGDAIVILEGQEDLNNALKHHNQNMGRRYIEVMPVGKADVDHALSRQPGVSDNDFVVRLRGLPYSATARDVLNLLHDSKVVDGEKGVRFTFAPDGRPSGEAFVELSSEEDVSRALGHNNEHMGKRYVEIFRSTRGQLEWDCRMAEKVGGGTGGVVRLRGLPYRCTEEDIRHFFQGMSIPAGGITMQVDSDGRETGEAYVEFTNPDDAEKALYKDRQMIGHRYIEVFRSTHAEIRPVASKEGRWSRSTPYSRPGQWDTAYDGGYGGKYGSGYERAYRGRGRGVAMAATGYEGYSPYQYATGYDYSTGAGYMDAAYASVAATYTGGGGDQSLVTYPPLRSTQGAKGGLGDGGDKKHTVRMRGLPYSSKEKDIQDFFSPHIPIKIEIDFDSYGRPSGEAEVIFSTHDEAFRAMEKHNAHMGHRYIELFLNSRASPPPGAPVAVGRGAPVPRGGGAVGGVPRYPAQSTWTDPRAQTGGQPGMYDHPQQQSQPQQQYAAQAQAYATYQQQSGQQVQQHWPQQGYTQPGQSSYQQPAYQQQGQPGQDSYSQPGQQAQTQWY